MVLGRQPWIHSAEPLEAIVTSIETTTFAVR